VIVSPVIGQSFALSMLKPAETNDAIPPPDAVPTQLGASLPAKIEFRASRVTTPELTAWSWAPWR